MQCRIAFSTMRTIIVAVALAALIGGNEASYSSSTSDQNATSEETSVFIQIATQLGYYAETKDVITEDGYILAMHHIPGNKTRAVLLVHGNTGTSDSFIVRGNTSLAITLAQEGYDVWAINVRGTRYSRRHLHINPDTQPEAFFDFSFYEHGTIDLPAAVDLVLQETGQQKLLAIGHSLGTTLLYVMGAERPEYNEKIKLGISLAPMCFMEHMHGVLGWLKLLGPFLVWLVKTLNVYELMSFDQTAPLLKVMCAGPIGYVYCVNNLFATFGYDDLDTIEPAFLPQLLSTWPGGLSAKTLEHIVQLIENKDFARFDYGVSRNRVIYNSSTAPAMDLGLVSMRQALLVGRHDFAATVPDTRRLNASLPNVVHYQVLPDLKFNHLDFIWDHSMPERLYPYLLPLIEQYI